MIRTRLPLASALGALLVLASHAIAQETLAPATAAPAAPADHGAMDHGAMGHGAAAPAEMSEASGAYMAAMERMDGAMAASPMTGEPAEDFVRMMIPHHQSAIDMAEAYLASGDDDPELRPLAEAIVGSQAAEIETLERWLAENGGN